MLHNVTFCIGRSSVTLIKRMADSNVLTCSHEPAVQPGLYRIEWILKLQVGIMALSPQSQPRSSIFRLQITGARGPCESLCEMYLSAEVSSHWIAIT